MIFYFFIFEEKQIYKIIDDTSDPGMMASLSVNNSVNESNFAGLSGNFATTPNSSAFSSTPSISVPLNNSNNTTATALSGSGADDDHNKGAASAISIETINRQSNTELRLQPLDNPFPEDSTIYSTANPTTT